MNSPHVLVASADPSLRIALVAHLGRLGCHVTTAVSGLDCLAKLRACPPNLLLLAPPLLWGSEAGVADRMKQDPALEAVPILVLGRAPGEDSVRTALDLVTAHLERTPEAPRVPGFARRPAYLAGPWDAQRFRAN